MYRNKNGLQPFPDKNCIEHIKIIKTNRVDGKLTAYIKK
jgi:hypothetical protein